MCQGCTLSSIHELVIPDQNVPCRDGSVILLLQLMYGASMPGYIPTTVDLGLMSVSLRSELDQQGPGFISGDPLRGFPLHRLSATPSRVLCLNHTVHFDATAWLCEEVCHLYLL